MILLTAIGVAIAAFVGLLWGGRNEPTAHGQAIIAQLSLLIAIALFLVVLVVGYFGRWMAWW